MELVGLNRPRIVEKAGDSPIGFAYNCTTGHRVPTGYLSQFNYPFIRAKKVDAGMQVA